MVQCACVRMSRGGEVEGEEEGGPLDCAETEDVLTYHVCVCWLAGG